MASPPYSFDPTDPSDIGIVAQFPQNERSLRDILTSYINTEHDPNSGRHIFPAGTTAQRNAQANITNGNVWYNSDTGTLQIYEGGWDETGPAAQIPATTKMLFVQSSAPTGWTQDVSFNDRVLRIVSGGTGGNTGGSWTISGTSLTIATHILTVTEIPAHTHNVTIAYQNGAVTAGGAGTMATPGTSTYTSDVGTGGGAAHGHPGSTFGNDATWRPSYVDVIACTKD